LSCHAGWRWTEELVAMYQIDITAFCYQPRVTKSHLWSASTMLRISPLRCFPSKPFINSQFKASFLSTKVVNFGRPSCSARFFSLSHWRFQESQPPEHNKTEKENIYTIPNVLTLSRILSCPILGWSILDGNYYVASGLLVYAGLTDMARFISHPSQSLSKISHEYLQLDGYLARRYRMSTVLGTILDPAADKALMTTLTITLTMQNLIPGKKFVLPSPL
jgi:hypothetical protein